MLFFHSSCCREWPFLVFILLFALVFVFELPFFFLSENVLCLSVLPLCVVYTFFSASVLVLVLCASGTSIMWPRLDPWGISSYATINRRKNQGERACFICVCLDNSSSLTNQLTWPLKNEDTVRIMITIVGNVLFLFFLVLQQYLRRYSESVCSPHHPRRAPLLKWCAVHPQTAFCSL